MQPVWDPEDSPSDCLLALTSGYSMQEREAMPPEDAAGAPRVWKSCPGLLLPAQISNRSRTHSPLPQGAARSGSHNHSCNLKGLS